MTTEFKSDGCTLFPDGRWKHCCIEHDRAYAKGGSKKRRWVADIKLLSCVAATGHPYIAIIMFLGVRMFGSPWWPTRVRWGRTNKFNQSFTYKRSEQCRNHRHNCNAKKR